MEEFRTGFTKGIISFVAINLFITINLFCFPTSLFAQKQTTFQKEARLLRSQGLQFQQRGDLDSATVCYQKAIELDPAYVIAYNDLGIMFEAKGLLDRAEKIYLVGLKLNPQYHNLYSNLAMLYEQKRELKKAFDYWKKRIELGIPGESWVEWAKRRRQAIAETQPSLQQELIEEETLSLVRELAIHKKAVRLTELKEIQKLKELADDLYEEHKIEEAKNALVLAISLDPSDRDSFLTLIDKINKEIKEKQKQEHIAIMQAKFQDAIRFYEQDDIVTAKQTLEKIATELTPKN